MRTRHLRAVRLVAALFLLVAACPLHAQCVDAKRLVTSLGGGVGTLTVNRSPRALVFGPESAGAATFRFAYGASQRISFGFHYDRIGTDRTPEQVDRVRFTTYLAEVSYRPWQSERSAIELSVSLGTSIMSLRTNAADLPLIGQSTTGAIGARYMRLLSKTVGVFLSVDHAGSRDLVVKDYDGNPIEVDGGPVRLSWNSQRMQTGLLIRF